MDILAPEARLQLIAQAVEKLKSWDDNYHNGEALVSDEEYDELRAWVLAEDKDNPYFKTAGAPVRTGKEKLPVPMPSLDQSHDQKDLTNWITKYNLQHRYLVATEKLDGFSCLLVYENRYLVNAFSRGNTLEGASVIRHLTKVSFVPKVIGTSGTQYIRGEVILKPSIFAEKYNTLYKNPRNMVSGCMNRTETKDIILKDFDFIAHEWVEFQGTKNESIVGLQLNGFVTPFSSTIPANALLENGHEQIEKIITEFKNDSDYELDGVVITVDDLLNVEEISKSSSLNPEHSIKYKLESEGKQTAVVCVHYELSKNNLFKPRIEINPIELNGVTITFATGHNGKFIVDNKIGKGAIVLITRQGDVIPYCKAVLVGTEPDYPSEDWEWNESQVEFISLDKNNPEVIFKQVLDFFVSLEVDLLKEASLRLIFDAYKLDGQKYTDILGTIFDLTDTEFENAIGANGLKIRNSLHRRLQNVTMPILMGSLNYCGTGFGIRKATALLEQIAFEKITSAADIVACHGFDDKTAEKIFAGLPQVVHFMDKFSDYLKFKEEAPKGSALANIIVVMTGFRDKELHAKIESLGGKVGSSVSGKTTHVLTVDPTNLTGKLIAAKEKGIVIMTPENFKDAFNL